MKHLLFDLDGTLLDTAPEFLTALNKMLINDHLPLLTLDTVIPFISKGSEALVRHAYNHKLKSEEFDTRHADFLHHYKKILGNEAKLFNGMPEVLEAIEMSGRLWGVVTNKPSEMTAPLLKKLNLFHRAACVVSGDTTPYPKPHPAPLLKACSMMNQKIKDCIYVGDDRRDITAAKAAHMQSIVALYGYQDFDDHPKKWGASDTIEKPTDLMPALQLNALPATSR